MRLSVRFAGSLLGALVSLGLYGLSACASAQTNVVRVDVSGRGREDVVANADVKVRQMAQNFQKLIAPSLEARRQADRSRTRSALTNVSVGFPVRVDTYRDGVRLQTPRSRDNVITLQFDTTGARAFPESYRNFLQSVFDTARSTMNVVFGDPAISGTVRVTNWDLDINDREAVIGGYYLSNNGSSEREIRFPIYNSPEAAAVNFIHCLLLAYLPDQTYAFDAFNEGLVRAATMRVARQASALPSLDAEIVESVLGNGYDTQEHYDWYNQRALSSSRFIPANLLTTPLPAGGSLGGVYLLRYRMAGSAWYKVLAEYPTFLNELNKRFRANTAIRNDLAALVTLGQQTLAALRPSDPTVEGKTFATWFAEQAVLESKDTLGLKLAVETVPIVSGLSGPDFGVFLIQAHYWESRSNGDEILLSGTSYPVFWSNTFERILPDAQSEKMDIAGAYGSVAPNFENQNSGRPYRVAFDLPVQDRIVRTYLPAGAVATASSAGQNTFYGSVVGVTPVAGATLTVRLSVGSEIISDIPVVDNVFGTRITSSNFLAQRSVIVELIQTTGTGSTVLLTRRVNKSPGALAVDLKVSQTGNYQWPLGITTGLQLLGLPVTPLSSNLSDVIAQSETTALVARYNGSRARYDLFPDTGALEQGQGFFLRSSIEKLTHAFPAKIDRNTPLAVAVRPGWNMISIPGEGNVNVSSIIVARTTRFPRTWADATSGTVGSTDVDMGAEVFGFTPGANDPVTGMPEGGTLSPVTTLVPGKGYFVRCLAAEGATLLFPSESSRGRAVNRSRADTRRHFTLTATAERGKEKTSAIMRLTTSATNGFDVAEDSPLPPSPGGLQIQIENEANFYREVRRLGRDTTFRVRVDGMQKGKTYTISFLPEGVRAREVIVRDRLTGKRFRVNRRTGVIVAGRTTPYSFDVTIKGAR